MADVLSKRYILLNTLDAKLLSFEYIKEFYAYDLNFSNIYNACEIIAFNKFYRHDGYLFRLK